MPAMRRSFCASQVRSYGPTRIELSSQFSEVERPHGKIQLHLSARGGGDHVPRGAAVLLARRLQCFRQPCAGARCRRRSRHSARAASCACSTSSTTCARWREIDAASFALIKRVIFGTDADPAPELCRCSTMIQAALLLEVMKDLLYQAYVRKGAPAAGHGGAALLLRRGRAAVQRSRQRRAPESHRVRRQRALRSSPRPRRSAAATTRALRNMRIQPLSSPASRGCQEFCTLR